MDRDKGFEKRGRDMKKRGARRQGEDGSKKKKLIKLAVKSFLPEELCGHIGCNIRCPTPRELQLHMAKDHRTP